MNISLETSTTEKQLSPTTTWSYGFVFSKQIRKSKQFDIIFWNEFLDLVFIFHFFLFKNKKLSSISTLISGIKFTNGKKI